MHNSLLKEKSVKYRLGIQSKCQPWRPSRPLSEPLSSVCVCVCIWLNSSVMHDCASPLHMHASVTSMFEKSHTPVSKRRSSQFSRPSSQIPSQRYAVLGQHGLSVVLFQTLAHARIIKEVPICWWRDGWALMSALVPHQHLTKMYFSCWQKPKAT